MFLLYLVFGVYGDMNVSSMSMGVGGNVNYTVDGNEKLGTRG